MKLTPQQLYYSPRMTREAFRAMVADDWQPREISTNTRPAFLANLPDVKIVKLFGSGSASLPNPGADGNPDYGQIGGIDVYRKAEPEDGVALNKDWYLVLPDPNDSAMLVIIGPERDNEHWIDSLPERLAYAYADASTIESDAAEARSGTDPTANAP